MLKKCLCLLAIACCTAGAAFGDTLQLKDQASITGKILAEKRDQVAVDVGYTVLVVPRNQIKKIVSAEAPKPGSRSAGAVKAAASCHAGRASRTLTDVARQHPKYPNRRLAPRFITLIRKCRCPPARCATW